MTLAGGSSRTLGLIGTGAIGGLILQALAEKRIPYDRAVVLARSRRAETEARVVRSGGSVVSEAADLIDARPGVVVEAAGHEAVRAYALSLADAGLDMILMSIGALADEAVHTPLEDTARQHGATIWLPSGGVGGLDALAAARALGDLERVTHRTIKRRKD